MKVCKPPGDPVLWGLRSRLPSRQPLPLVLHRAHEWICCCCCPDHQLEYLSLGEKKMMRRDVNRKLPKMKLNLQSLRSHLSEKSTGSTALSVFLFSLLLFLLFFFPLLLFLLFFFFFLCYRITEALAKKEEAPHLLLGSLSFRFSLTACWLSRALLFFFHVGL